MGELVHLGRVQPPRPFEEWLDDLLGSKVYIPADLTADVVRRAQNLFAITERGDPLIAATAAARALLVRRACRVDDREPRVTVRPAPYALASCSITCATAVLKLGRAMRPRNRGNSRMRRVTSDLSARPV